MRSGFGRGGGLDARLGDGRPRDRLGGTLGSGLAGLTERGEELCAARGRVARLRVLALSSEVLVPSRPLVPGRHRVRSHLASFRALNMEDRSYSLPKS